MTAIDNDFEHIPEPDLDSKRVNKAISYACRILGTREYSKLSICQKLQQKGYEPNEVKSAVNFLTENNWLDDKRFCEVFLRSKINRGLGLSRIKFELLQKGISQELIDKELARNEIDWQAQCDEVSKNKTRFLSITENQKHRAKLERFLRYRGFSGEQIRKSIHNISINNNIN